MVQRHAATSKSCQYQSTPPTQGAPRGKYLAHIKNVDTHTYTHIHLHQPIHPQQQRYDLKVPKIPLDGAALAKLKKGQPVKKQINAAGGKSGGRGIVVQDVHAPSSVVMDRILDFKKYPQMVPNVAKCENYAQRRMVNVRMCVCVYMWMGCLF